MDFLEKAKNINFFQNSETFCRLLYHYTNEGRFAPLTTAWKMREGGEPHAE